MAHLVVHLERRPGGIHPGSEIALCMARDLANRRGASVTAIAVGDAGANDDALSRRASQLGADQIFFVGPKGLAGLCVRLMPTHVLTSASPSAMAVLEEAGIGPIQPCWLVDPGIDLSLFDPVVAFVPGLLPWHDCPLELDPEYEGDVGEAPLPDWATNPPEVGSRKVYIASGELDPATETELRRAGAEPGDASAFEDPGVGLVLWVAAPGVPLAPAALSRPPAQRLVVLTSSGPAAGETEAEFDIAWTAADFVLPGSLSDSARALQSEIWRAALP